jgi:hypothetical protein
MTIAMGKAGPVVAGPAAPSRRSARRGGAGARLAAVGNRAAAVRIRDRGARRRPCTGRPAAAARKTFVLYTNIKNETGRLSR